MRPLNGIIWCSVRNIRHAIRTKKNVKSGSGRAVRPVQWVEDAAVYNEAFSANIDSYASPPYPQEALLQLKRMKEAEDLKNSTEEKKQEGIDFSHIPVEDQAVILFPGQGSQFVGMGSRLKDCPGSMALFDKASEVLKYDVKKLCFEGPKTKLDQTIYSQPAIFVTSMAALEKAKQNDEHLMERVTHSAGFSVGEYNSLVLAGVLSFEKALHILRVRAEAMHECSQKVPSGMMSIQVSRSTKLNIAMQDARNFALEKNEHPLCEIANFLFCGVKVIGASKTCMDFLEQNQDRYCFKVLKRLPVSGAFHTKLMKGAVYPLEKVLRDVQLNKPKINIYSNYTGSLYKNNVRNIRSSLINQVHNPVKWEQIQQVLFRLHENHKFPTYIEVGPGRQLGAMFRQVSKKAFSFYKNVDC